MKLLDWTLQLAIRSAKRAKLLDKHKKLLDELNTLRVLYHQSADEFRDVLKACKIRDSRVSSFGQTNNNQLEAAKVAFEAVKICSKAYDEKINECRRISYKLRKLGS